MENKSHAFAAGLFVLVVTALVIGLGVWLTRDRGKYETYELSSGEGVAGLQPQAAVRYKGVSVGRVTHIGFDSQASGNVLIRIAVSVDAPITPTTFAVLGYQGVTGLAYVLLDDAGEPYPAIAPGPSGLPRLPLRTSPFTQLFDQGPAILSRVQEATERINQVLSDDNQRLLRELLANTGQADRLAANMIQRPSPLWYGLVIAFTGAERSCSSYGLPPARAAETRVPVAQTPVASSEVPTFAPRPVRSRW